MKNTYDETLLVDMLEHILRRTGNVAIKKFAPPAVTFLIETKVEDGVIVEHGQNLCSLIQNLENRVAFSMRPQPNSQLCTRCRGIGKIIDPQAVQAQMILTNEYRTYDSFDVVIARLTRELIENLPIIQCPYCYGSGYFL